MSNRGKYAEAEESFGKAFAIFRKSLGDEHPDTATSYNLVALNLDRQGKYADAEEGFRKALAICRKHLGEDHPNTTTGYDNLAFNLNDQDKYRMAEDIWQSASASFVKARLRIAASGLDRATKTSERSPFPRVAAVLARNGKPEWAWQRFEESLARGTWDDASFRFRCSPADQSKRIQLVSQLDRIDKLIEKTLVPKQSPEQENRRKELLGERLKLQAELEAFRLELEKTYGPAAGEVFDKKGIQKTLSPDTALIGWLDIEGHPKAADPNGEHWAVMLRSTGDPLWVRLQGSGKNNAWTKDDTDLPRMFRAAVESPAGDCCSSTPTSPLPRCFGRTRRRCPKEP